MDPIELQHAAEGLLTEQERTVGLNIARENGMPAEPGSSAAMEMHADKSVRAERMRNTEGVGAASRGSAMDRIRQDSQVQQGNSNPLAGGM